MAQSLCLARTRQNLPRWTCVLVHSETPSLVNDTQRHCGMSLTDAFFYFFFFVVLIACENLGLLHFLRGGWRKRRPLNADKRGRALRRGPLSLGGFPLPVSQRRVRFSCPSSSHGLSSRTRGEDMPAVGRGRGAGHAPPHSPSGPTPAPWRGPCGAVGGYFEKHNTGRLRNVV